jgi:RNA polymerase sigma-70 factor (ECF subfamily)
MGWGHREDAVSQLSIAPADAPPAEATPTGSLQPSFESIYRAHVKTVARWAMRLLGPSHDCEDVVQEVFLVVRRRLPEFRGDAEITTWLYEITVRVARDWRRRARWWSWVTGRGGSPSRGRNQASFVPTAAMPEDPQAVLEAHERTRVLYRLLDEVGEPYRTTFILFELEGLSGEQIAKITGAQLGTVWVRLSRARCKFLQRMRAWEARRKP